MFARFGQHPGAVAVVFGATLALQDEVDLEAADVVLSDLVTHDEIGLHGLGDLDGDGLDELLVGDPRYDGSGNRTGRVLLYGGDDLAGGGALAPTDADLTILGTEPYAFFGAALAGLGDVDGDGLPDFAVGAHDWPTFGQTFYFSGSSAAAGGVMSVFSADAAFEGFYGRYFSAGWSVAGPGDVDGDGLGDLWIGAENNPGGAILVLSPW